jgi:hypothetical protein
MRTEFWCGNVLESGRWKTLIRWDANMEVGLIIVTRLRTRRLGLDSRSGERFFSSPPFPDRLWGPASLLSEGQRGLFLQGRADAACI